MLGIDRVRGRTIVKMPNIELRFSIVFAVSGVVYMNTSAGPIQVRCWALPLQQLVK